MSTLLNKSYLVKVSMKGEGGQKCPKLCLHCLYTLHSPLTKLPNTEKGLLRTANALELLAVKNQRHVINIVN